jgi:hypothetical protein
MTRLPILGMTAHVRAYLSANTCPEARRVSIIISACIALPLVAEPLLFCDALEQFIHEYRDCLTADCSVIEYDYCLGPTDDVGQDSSPA